MKKLLQPHHKKFSMRVQLSFRKVTYSLFNGSSCLHLTKIPHSRTKWSERPKRADVRGSQSDLMLIKKWSRVRLSLVFAKTILWIWVTTWVPWSLKSTHNNFRGQWVNDWQSKDVLNNITYTKITHSLRRASFQNSW